MSHFFTMVLLPNHAEDVDEGIAQLLAPYDENLEVDAYQRTCWCVKNSAADRANAIVDQEFGTIDSARDEFAKIWEATPKKPVEDPHDLWWQEQEVWEKFIRPRQNRREELTAEFLKDAKPDPECEDCNGTGTYETTYNPKSKWDWYTVGGRWSGTLDDYNPYTDPKNQQECWLCKGTGIRTDRPDKEQEKVQATVTVAQMSQAFTDIKNLSIKLSNTDLTGADKTALREQMYKVAKEIGGIVCNGCLGTGIMTKFSSTWDRHPGDILPVEILLSYKPEEFNRKIPFAILTPDGEWHEKGEMGWWGMSSCNIDTEEWDEAAKIILEMNRDCTAVVVDCHI